MHNGNTAIFKPDGKNAIHDGNEHEPRGGKALLDPTDTVFLLLDHQSGMFQNVKDISVAELRANTTALAKLATLCEIPVITTASVPDIRSPERKSTMRYTTPFLLLALLSAGAAAAAAPQQVGTSPWGPKDEIGRLNLITPASRSAILSRVSGQKSYDLGVDFYIGMPSWQAAGDPPYQMWMTHTPHGNVVADSMKVGEKMNRHVSYTGSAVSMYAHMGTHIDALNHFGLNGKIWNGFSEAEYLGDRGWTVTGAEKLPPIIARGVLIDVATAKGLQKLPDNYRISRKDLRDALDLQGVKLEKGDVVLIRTGRMRDYDNAQVFMANPPGLSLDGAKFLVEDGGAMVVGADNLSLEAFPSEVSDNYLPVHTYLLAQQGAPIIELLDLEALARDRVYQFAFIGASLKFRGGDAAPIRPIALPIQ